MVADHETIARLVKTARGQLDGVLRMVEEDRYCVDVANQLMAADAVIKKAAREVLRAHMAGCVADAMQSGNSEQALDEVMALIERMTR